MQWVRLTTPANWKEVQKEKQKEEIALVKGARLKRSNLRYTQATDSFLVKADLRGANLQEATLRGANLQGADLFGAKLQGANLFRANLQRADLQDAKLRGAKLQGATLVGANLQGAFLYGTTGFTASQVKAAKNWELAFYRDFLLEKLGLPPDHNEKVKRKLAEMERKKKATGSK